mgnify:CR=1 FL=1
MSCGNGFGNGFFGGGNSCLWIVLILIILCCCCGNGFGFGGDRCGGDRFCDDDC